MASRLPRAQRVFALGVVLPCFLLLTGVCRGLAEPPRLVGAPGFEGQDPSRPELASPDPAVRHPVAPRLFAKPPKPGSNATVPAHGKKHTPKQPKEIKRWLLGAGPQGAGAQVTNLCIDCERGTVGCDETVSGTLEPDDCDLGDGTYVDSYRLELEEFQDLRIELRSAAFDAFLILEDLEDQCVLPAIGSNNDCDGGQDSCLEVGLPAGTYYIFANSFGTAATGDYELEVICQRETDCTDCVVGSISCGGFRTRDFPRSDCKLPDGSSLDVWSLEITESQQITVELSTPEFDGYLWLFDESCAPVASNDDCVEGDSTSSCLLVDVDPGTYHVGVNSYNAGETGTYDLHVACVDFQLCRDCVTGELECGGTVASEFPASGCSIDTPGLMVDLYSLDHQTGGPLEVYLNANFFDTVLGLFTADCELIEWNDDCGGGGTNSCLLLDLPRGEYFVAVSSFSSGETGAYELQAGCPGGASCQDLVVETVGCDTLTQGSLPAGILPTTGSSPRAVYQLEIDGPTVVDAEARSTAFSPSLRLLDEECLAVDGAGECGAAAQGAGAEEQGACLSGSLPAGTYFIEVTAVEAGGSGPFELEVRCESFNACSACRVGSLECDETVEGELSEVDCLLEDGTHFQVWQLLIENEGEVDIHMSSAEFDTYLFLLDDACEAVASNDDCTGGTDSCLEGVLLAPGEYFVVANTFTAGESGAYGLEVTCSGFSLCEDCNAEAIECGETRTGMLSDGDCMLEGEIYADVWSLSVTETRDLDLVLSSEDFDTYLYLLDGSCQVLVSNDDCSVAVGTDSCLEGLTLEPGQYHVVAGSFAAGETGEYSLEVLCVEEPGGLQLPGDSNQDGELNITDAVRLLRYLLQGTVTAFPCGDGSFTYVSNKSLLDFDGDQAVDVLDIIGILQYLFEPGPPHVKGSACVRLRGCPDVCVW